MSCWTVLGLTADADTRSIKRQYAALLKQTRPDEDAEGFQRLRDAYEQALNYKEWAQANEDNEAQDDSWDLTGLTVVEVDALQQAIRSLHGTSLAQLQQRHALAVEQGCAHILEETLLQHCIEHPDTSAPMVDWAVQTYHWFGAWQRLELDEESIELLLDQQRERMTRPLRDALEREDSAAFLQAYAQSAQCLWLDAEVHRLWFNLFLSRLLLDSEYWSSDIFEQVCAGQSWHPGPANRCPQDEWKRLIARHESPLFIARQRQLAEEPPATAEHRAARLLLGTGPFSQRRALARRLREEDWLQCRQLSSALYANHPKVCAELPGGTAFFWRDWELSRGEWPTYLGVVLACLIGAFAHFIPLGLRVTGLFNIFMVSIVVFGVIAAGLNWLAHDLAHRYWLLDDWLSARLCPGIAAPFGVIRDLIPCALMVAGLTWLFGPVGGVVYATTLAVVGLVRRRQVQPHVSWEQRNPLLKICLVVLGVVALVIALGVLNVIASKDTVTRNQGLQPWAERLCSRLPATATGCGAPATREQWYGAEAKP
ncbi:J domain-containing protein [Pseudomonas fluorescens]|uniref:J domain-containing protein n=1 Tax=Pseudomonas fluorescens TaxID=294 RepID=UPI00112FFDF2|nr:J domain-containing protein [Pseudomonas fluorescens]TMU71918.1 J domain-containing protein [Pseudomonas fluorescens]